MFKHLIAGTILLTSTVSAYAAVLLQAPEEIIVVALNDQSVSGGLFSSSHKSYQLDAGKHKISVQYKQLFNPDYVSHEVVRSGVVTLQTSELIDGQTYQLVLVNPPKDLDEGRKFASQPTIALKDAQGKIVAQQTGVSQARSWLGSLGSVLDLRQNTEQPVVETQQPVSTQQVATSVQDVKGTLSKDRQLIELWKAATPQERQKFTAWLAEQASK